MKSLSLALMGLAVAAPVTSARAQAPIAAVVPASTQDLTLAGSLAARQQISIRPLQLVFNELAADYERLVARHFSLVGTVGLSAPSSWSQGPAADRLDAILGLAMPSNYAPFGLAVELGTRWYPGDRGIGGVFVHPSVGWDLTTAGTSANPDPSAPGTQHVPTTHRIAVNVRAGYQWLLARHLVITLDGGVAYKINYAAEAYVGDLTHMGRGGVGAGWTPLGIAPNVHVGIGGWF